MKINFDKRGRLWHGFHIWRNQKWYDLGIFSVDFYKYLSTVKIYFWKFVVTFERKINDNAPN